MELDGTHKTFRNILGQTIEVYKNNGCLHREDGPCFINHITGEKTWRHYDTLHRLDGPAVIGLYGETAWYINGVRWDD